jgi:hypothetical protein
MAAEKQSSRAEGSQYSRITGQLLDSRKEGGHMITRQQDRTAA